MCHVLVHKTVHTLMHLFQVHLLVLERVREERRDREAEICWFQDGIFAFKLHASKAYLSYCRVANLLKRPNWKDQRVEKCLK